MVELPRRQELVICTIKKIMPYGAEVEFEEYKNIKGFVPLSQVAQKWIKNIRNVIKINQIKVAKVIYINYQKNQVDVSFSRVSPSQEKKKINEWKTTKRVQQLLNVLAKELNEDVDNLWDIIVEPVLEKYNSVYDAFQDIATYGKDYVNEVPEKYREHLYKILKKSIKIKDINNQIIKSFPADKLVANPPNSTP